MKKMSKSKQFMRDNQFDFAQIMNKKEPRPLQDLLLQLGISNEKNVFQKAKEHNFTTFFSGPKQIRDLIETDFDTTDHQNFISQFLIDDNLCLKDGRKLVNDQLEKMSAFLTSTSDKKVFSTLFLDEYGSPKSSIDHDFRLLSSLHFNYLLNELIDQNVNLTGSPFIVQPTWRNCVSEGISQYSCICMNMNLTSGYPKESEKDFVETLNIRFTNEVKKHKCVKSFETEDYQFFYDYALNTSKEIRGVELTGFVNITGFTGEKRLMLKKMFTFKKNFESFRSFDTARVIVGHEVNIGIASLCDL
uniref:DUF3883 domain-containing protein n=2 Tax=Caenorhabditis tropicalis TaxID=1561998 RepID=A0A1I7TS68_9PELO